MPSGDSITVGAQSTETGGYRVPLFQTATKSGKHFTFVGPSGAGPTTVDGLPFPDAHDGHSGYVIDTIGSRKGLLPLMEPNLIELTPHIVLLMIGTNDINSQLEVAQAPERLAKLLDVVATKAPSALLVVAKLVPTRTDSLNEQVRTYNDAVGALVSERSAAGEHIALVDMYAAFTQNSRYQDELLFDGLHPNDAGYAVMAEAWYEAIGGYLR
jgi:lysophospholipase L1-like esterase